MGWRRWLGRGMVIDGYCVGGPALYVGVGNPGWGLNPVVDSVTPLFQTEGLLLQYILVSEKSWRSWGKFSTSQSLIMLSRLEVLVSRFPDL
jgi:hypothetical protein